MLEISTLIIESRNFRQYSKQEENQGNYKIITCKRIMEFLGRKNS